MMPLWSPSVLLAEPVNWPLRNWPREAFPPSPLREG